MYEKQQRVFSQAILSVGHAIDFCCYSLWDAWNKLFFVFKIRSHSKFCLVFLENKAFLSSSSNYFFLRKVNAILLLQSFFILKIKLLYIWKTLILVIYFCLTMSYIY